MSEYYLIEPAVKPRPSRDRYGRIFDIGQGAASEAVTARHPNRTFVRLRAQGLAIMDAEPADHRVAHTIHPWYQRSE